MAGEGVLIELVQAPAEVIARLGASDACVGAHAPSKPQPATAARATTRTGD